MDSVTLGRTMKDSTTGFTGVATAQTEYLGRTSRLVLVERLGTDGSMKSEWFDASRLAYVDTTGA